MAIEPEETITTTPEVVLEKERPIDATSSSSHKSDAPDNNEKSAVVVDSQYEESSVGSSSDVFDIKAIDPVLSRKMALVNTAIDQIGMTSFQWKLFYLNGFGYAVDSV
jgi:hypothetical protein